MLKVRNLEIDDAFIVACLDIHLLSLQSSCQGIRNREGTCLAVADTVDVGYPESLEGNAPQARAHIDPPIGDITLQGGI